MNKNNRYNFLNIYKFIFAIIIACFLHYHDHFLGPLKLIDHFENHIVTHFLVKNSGALTEFFFIASGILFFIAYVPKIRDKKMTFEDFLINRIKRLLPYVVITTLIMWVLQIICYKTTKGVWGPVGTTNFSEVIINIITFGRGIVKGQSLNGPTWYISVLMLCYIIGYFLTKQYIKTNNPFIYFIPVVIGIGIYINVPFDNNILFINIPVARGLFSFFEGILLHILINKFDKINIKNKVFLKIISILIILISIVLLSNYRYYPCLGDINLFISFILFPAIIYFSYNSKFLERISNNKIVSYIGNLSFDIYMMNFIVLCISYIIIKKLNILPNMLEKKWFLIWKILALANIIIPIHAYLIRKRVKFLIKKTYVSQKK